MIPLEDDPCDVIRKAMAGLGFTAAVLAEKANIEYDQVASALDGDHDDTILARIAPVLHLSARALIALPSYKPDVSAPDGLYQFVTPFGHAGVNAYVIGLGGRAAIFDTGTDSRPITEFLKQKGMTADTLYITHRHHDHTAGITGFGKIRIVYPEDCQDGAVLMSEGNRSLTTFDVSGHLPIARAYYYEGLTTPVCVLGDSIFAGSMGKAPNPKLYQQALMTARQNILTLPLETIICPGHGPLTSIAEELDNNPFLNVV